jgi:hypothetical protein
MVSNLYNDAQGIASAANFASLLGDYWSLGLESNIRDVALNTQITSGSILTSGIGTNSLTVGYQVYASEGKTTINVATDVPQYNNMFVTSLLPQSDFQYSWIRDGMS